MLSIDMDRFKAVSDMPGHAQSHDKTMKWLPMAFSVIMLITSATSGHAQNIDCRSCHAPNGVSGVRDFSQFYIHPPDGHPIGHGFVFNHQIGQKYPARLSASQKTNCSARPAPRRRGIAAQSAKSGAPRLKSNPPSGLPACQEGGKGRFNPPNGRSAGIEFFDRNGNGQPDSDEIQLFAAIDEATGEVVGESDDVTVECSSCHKAHGDNPAAVNASGNFYLRINNGRSALCLTCHSK